MATPLEEAVSALKVHLPEPPPRKEKNCLNDEVELSLNDKISTQQEHIITEIESADGHLGTALRSVYEGEKPEKFLDRLKARVSHHDKDIERLCNYHYQGFIESIHSLLQVRDDVQHLKEEVQKTNENLQTSGSTLISKADQLIQHRQTQRNITIAIESLSLCLPVLDTYSKLLEQMKSKRYYPALKTLEQLEHAFLPRVTQFRFSQSISNEIPVLRKDIRDSSMSDLKDFLESIMKHSESIGEMAMVHAARQNKMGIEMNLITVRGNIEDSVDCVQDMIDFSPVYRCLHIYSVLGARETLENYYRKQRRKQARLAVKAPRSMSLDKDRPPDNQHDTLLSYKKYFHEIVGFFVVEQHILNTCTDLANRTYVEELWETAVSKIVAVLRTHATSCVDPNLVLKIKKLIMIFSSTLKSYGYSVSQLYDLLLEIRNEYGRILMLTWESIFEKIFAEDNYTPMQISSEADLQELMNTFPYDELLNSHDFPLVLPFSELVPKVYVQVKEYIYACLKFSEDLHLSMTEMDDTVRKLANVLVTRTLSKCLSTLIRKPVLTLTQLIQLSINMNYLEKACIYLEHFICNVTGSEQTMGLSTKLQTTAMFKDSRSEAEDQIYLKFNEKIDDFLELADYDFLAEEPMEFASDYLTDVINFLMSTFSTFTTLPEKVAQTACLGACKHIASVLKDNVLINSQITSLSVGFLQQVSLDITECEKFAASDPVPGLNNGTLQLAFSELRQLLDLFISWDWSAYLADLGHERSKYLRVNPNDAILLLEKLREGDRKKTSILTSFGRNDKKKLLDTVLKQLRQQVTVHQN